MTQRAVARLATLVVCLTTASNAAHILGVFPMPAKSHFNVNYAILKSLNDAGHRVTMITPFPSEKKVENFTHIVPPLPSFSFVNLSAVDQWADMSAGHLMNRAGPLLIELCESVMNMPEILEALRSSEKLYDVLMAEYTFEFLCYLPLAQKLGIPVIATMTMRGLRSADHSIGVSTNPAAIPVALDSSSIEMNLLERFNNLWNYLNIEYHYMFLRWETERTIRKYFPTELLNKKLVSLIFYNNHPSMFSRSSVPNAIDVGGIHVTPAKPLPDIDGRVRKGYRHCVPHPKGRTGVMFGIRTLCNLYVLVPDFERAYVTQSHKNSSEISPSTDIQKFIEEARHGVILLTFGSVVQSSSMPLEQKQAFLMAFASIPQRVIWRHEKVIENLPENIMISSWLPQRDILEHKNVIAFMSHCGQSGVYEAVVTGTPVVTIPLRGDQKLNAALLAYRGVGVNLDFRTATKETVLAALNAIVNDTRYYQRMQELSRIFKDRPMTPQESVVYWTEYVIRHNGAPHLRAIGTDMPLYKYLMLDIIALGLLLMYFVITLIYAAVGRINTLFAKKPRRQVYAKKNE